MALSGSFQTSPTVLAQSQATACQRTTSPTQTPQYNLDSLNDLNNIPVGSPASQGSSAGGGMPSTAPVSLSAVMPSNSITGPRPPETLGNLATLTPGAEMATVTHYNIASAIDIYGNVVGTDLASVSTRMNTIIADMQKQLPHGSQLVVRGQVQTMHKSFESLYFGLAFSIVLIYLLIVVNFQSWLDPFIIIAGLPAALAGIVWMLFITGTHVSVPALTGAIMCMGVATANSILVVTFAREYLEQHPGDAIEAAIAAGHTRFRPVIMTALAMIIGMIPMALGLGDGGQENAPLGRAVIGGLLFATVSTLFLIPSFFSVVHARLERKHQEREKKKREREAQHHPHHAQATSQQQITESGSV